MQRKNGRTDKTLHWVTQYTIIFFITCLLVYSLQIYYGKSFIFADEGLTGDGLVQHYNSLAYYGNWLRSLLKNVFVEHIFSIPEYDLSIGLGGDIITTLNYYVLGDPLNLFSVFIPAAYTEFLYHILIVLRLYMAGIAFYLYCGYHSYEKERILPGAVIYVFSFYSIGISIMHPFFLNPLIYFPLILLGIDKVLKERKPLPFILSCALAAVSNFYFFYMMTILMVIYGVIRYLQYHLKELKMMLLLQEVGRFILYYVVAIMIAAPVFLPTILAVFGSNRAGGRSNVPVIYELIYYIKLPIAFLNACADYYAYLGYGAIAVMAVALLFFKTKWKEKIGFKVAFVLGTIFLLFPFFGHVFNGFGYVTNRWVWGYCLVVALIVVEMFPDIVGLSPTGKWFAAGTTILFAIPTFYFRAEGSREKLLAAVIILAAFSVLLAVIIEGGGKCLLSNATIYLMIIVTGIFLNAFGFYTPFSGNYLQHFGKFGTAWQDMHSGPFSVLEGIEDHDFEEVRIDTSNLYFWGVRANSAMLYDINSVSFYYSMINENTNKFLQDLWIPSPYEHQYIDLDSRAMLLALLGVKYNIVKSGDELYLPYNYDSKVQEKNNYTLFESDASLPMAYWYDLVMSEQVYEALTPLQKQQAMLQAAVVPENILTDNSVDLQMADHEKLKFSNSISEYELEEAVGLKINDNRIEVEEAGAYLVLKTEPINKAERYFLFENLWYEGKKNSLITITDGMRVKSFEIKSSLDTGYADIHNFLCNLGYAGQHGDSYTIYFREPGVYTYDFIEIMNQPLENMNDWIEMRKETRVDYSFGEDSVLAHLNADKSGLLYIPIPYSSGWRARVDGDEVKIVKANDFGMGICMNKGEHTIELIYHTPYIRLGIVLMVLGIVGCIGIKVVGYRKKRVY